MKVVIVRTRAGNKYATRVAKEIENLGFHADIVCWEDVDSFVEENSPDPKQTLFHFRSAGPGANLKALNLERSGYRVINKPEVLERTSDKFKSFAWAGDKGCSLPLTKKGTRDEIKEIVSAIGFDKFVLKPINSKHQGALCFQSFKGDEDINEKLEKVPGKEVIIQEFVEYEKIYRVIVVGGKAISESVFSDEPNESRWKVSVCLNPDIKLERDPDPKLLQYAEDIADVFESEVAFVDVFQTANGYVLSEINTACNLCQHEDKSGFNISKRIAEYLVSQI